MGTPARSIAGPARLAGAAALPGAAAAAVLADSRVGEPVVAAVALALSAGAGALCLRVARGAADGPRWGWAAVGVGCAAWAAGQAAELVAAGVLGAAPGPPPPLQPGHLVFAVAALLGLRRLAAPAPGAGISAARRVVDPLVIGCALGLLSWVVVLDTALPALAAGTDRRPALLHPLSGVLLVTGAVLAVARAPADAPRRLLLGGGLLGVAVADHLLVHQLALGAERGGPVVGMGWCVGFGLIGAAALVPDGCPRRAAATPLAGRYALGQVAPCLAVVVAVAAAGADLVASPQHDPVATGLLVGLVLLVLAHQLVMVRENLALGAAVRGREWELRHQAFHDPLTGLPNRALFLERLADALDDADRDGHPVSVAFVDLDGFKAVNDALGHAVGDALLVQVADRLRAALPAPDALARLGGDEFAVLIERGDPTTVAQELVAALQPPFPVDGRFAAVSASVGVATAEPGGGPARAAHLLHRADVAMYAVKAAGKGHVQLHSPALDLARSPDRPALARAFAQALAEGRVRADYQPVVDPVSGRIVALEALARWVHDGVEVPPSAFIPICAQCGLFDRLTATMLEQACARLEEWSRALGHRRLRIAVNVNPTEFSDPALADRVAALIERHRLAPGQLALEMTEIAGGNRPDAAIEVMHRLRGLGVRLALDDFGTGHSTLARLARTPVDTVKIDQSFVTDIDHDEGQRAFLAALIELARRLGLRTVVEGAERPGQLRVLRRLRCDLVQGNAVGRPADAATTAALVLADRPLLPPELLDPVPEPVSPAPAPAAARASGAGRPGPAPAGPRPAAG